MIMPKLYQQLWNHPLVLHYPVYEIRTIDGRERNFSSMIHSQEITRSRLNINKECLDRRRSNSVSFTPSSYTMMSRLQHSSLRGCESVYQQFSNNPFVTTGEVTRQPQPQSPIQTSNASEELPTYERPRSIFSSTSYITEELQSNVEMYSNEELFGSTELYGGEEEYHHGQQQHYTEQSDQYDKQGTYSMHQGRGQFHPYPGATDDEEDHLHYSRANLPPDLEHLDHVVNYVSRSHSSLEHSRNQQSHW